MEEQPSVRAPQQRYHHGGERSPTRPRKTLKNEPSHCQHHHQETQAKKTGRVCLAKARNTVAPREDSWTLFKPPPVFPVDNSSAKIVPKISYASKVKENLNKESQAPPLPARLSHVPMSAVKTGASAAFANGPVSAEAACCSPAGPLLGAACPETPAPAVPAGENVASSPDSSGGSGEPRKPGLFVYPLTPAHMQAALPSARPVDVPSQQKALGDIFQNQWGLSFINEPSAGPEGAPGRPAVGGGGAAEVTFQGQCAARGAEAPGLDRPTLPKASDLDKRTSPHSLASVFKTCPPAPAAEGGAPLQPLVPDPQKGEAGSPGAIEFASAKDLGAESPQASPANPVLTAAKEQGQTKACDRSSSWGSFDLKAAVIYHTKEMEYILTLQKQDPKRVVVYDESKDRPDQ
nr:PREDICTED: nuclear fragile X mental retardation-interacting protein 2 [Lepisosteus oculatus]